MIRQDIDINGYWKIIVAYDVELGQKDSGFTYTDFKTKQSIVGIGKSTSNSQLLNTIVHEAKHIQSHIIKDQPQVEHFQVNKQQHMILTLN